MRQFIKFAIVGGIGTVINLGILYVLTEYAGVYYLYSAIAAFLVAMTNNFILNKMWTFEEGLHHEAAYKFAKFAAVSVAALALNLLCLYVFTELFGIYYVLSQALAIAAGLVVNFAGNSLWTFRKKSSSL